MHWVTCSSAYGQNFIETRTDVIKSVSEICFLNSMLSLCSIYSMSNCVYEPRDDHMDPWPIPRHKRARFTECISWNLWTNQSFGFWISPEFCYHIRTGYKSGHKWNQISYRRYISYVWSTTIKFAWYIRGTTKRHCWAQQEIWNSI